jgi:DNA repair protein RadC
MTITNWPLAERPREKLLAQGSQNLSNAELIAIFLRTGVRGKTAVDIARELLNEHGSLKKIFNIIPNPSQKTTYGIGKAKLATLKAAIELGRRYLEEDVQSGEIFANSDASKRFFMRRLRDYPHEVFACLFLNSQNQFICFEELFHGTLSEANVYPREVVKRSLQHNAAKAIFAHNHPSGNPTPSQADQEITRLLIDALALVGVQVIDHIIIGGQENISFAEIGLI